MSATLPSSSPDHGLSGVAGVSSAPPAVDTAADGLDRATLIVCGVVVLGSLMSILDSTVVNVALNTLSTDFGTSLSTIQWIVSGYTLALASVIPLSGWAADRFGAKQVWMAAIALFLAGSVLSGLAWSIGSLIAFRVVQGVGGGLILPVGTTIIARAAGPSKMGRVMSVIGVPLMLGPVLGPVLGGVLIQGLSWRWIFYVNVPIGIAALVLGRRLLPQVAPSKSERLDGIGVALLSPGLALLIYGLSRLSSAGGIGAAGTFLPLAAGVVLIAAFVVRALRTDAPLIDMRLFKGRAFSSAAATTFALGTATFGSLLLIPLYLQDVRRESVLQAGLLTAPQGLGMGAAMIVSGRLTDRIGAGRIVPVGLALSAVATLGLTQLSATTSYVLLSAILVILGLGLGSSMMPAMAAAYGTLDTKGVARATSGLQIVQRVGSAIGAAVFAVILQQNIASRIPSAPGGGLGGAQSARGPGAADSLAAAFGSTYWWALALTAVAVIPALLLPRTVAAAETPTDHANRADCHPMTGNTGFTQVSRAPQKSAPPPSARAAKTQHEATA